MDDAQKEREKLAYKYTSAMDSGDLDTVGEILFIAETDGVLDQMLQGIDEALDYEARTVDEAEAGEDYRFDPRYES